MAQTYIPAAVPSRSLSPAFGGGGVKGVVTLLSILTVAWISLYQLRPPAVVPVGAPPQVFSSGRAMKHLEIISAKIHPMGTSENAEVRAHIVGALSAAGLDAQVEQTTALSQTWEGVIRMGTVNNVVARLKGTGDGKAILLASHYDSAPTSFGASDDGAAVAVMLETLRAVRAPDAPLRNDVIFLFSDGEESGLLGAHAFVQEHPWAKDVGLVLNFEARGNGGASVMFETSDENGWLVREFAKAAPQPVANSLAYEIYRLLPNDTDLTVFKKAGLAGLNFAYIDGLTSYHTALDNFARIDERSLQHHGSYALALTRHFGNLDLSGRKEPNAVYFDIFGAALFHYPGAWVMPLGMLAAGLFAGLSAFGLRKKRLTLRGLSFGFVALLCAALIAPAVATLIWKLIDASQSVAGFRPAGGTYHASLYLLGFVCLSAAVVTVLYVWFFTKTSVENLWAGALLWWVMLTVVVGLTLPGASYLFVWPLLFSVLGLGLMMAFKPEGAASSRKLWPVLYLCAAPGIVLLAPTIYQMLVGLTLSMIGAMMVAVVLLCALLIPHLRLMTTPKKWLLPGGAALAGVIFIAAGLLTSVASASQPKLDTLFYALDADAGKAVWASFDKEPDEWTAQVLSGGVRRGTLPAIFSARTTAQSLQREAPVEILDAPNIELLGDVPAGAIRTLHMHVTSPRRAPVLTIYADSEMDIQGAQVNGKRIAVNPPPTGAGKNNWSLRYYAVPPEGIRLTMDIKASEPVKLRVVDQSYQLPRVNGAPFPARPDYIIAAPVSVTDSTFVGKSFTFPTAH